MCKASDRQVSAYFTVEAALVMPIVLGCYALIVLWLCLIYERSIWEENTSRLVVWMEYVEGYASLYPGQADSFTTAEISRYVQESMEGEEQSRYLLGENRCAQMTVKGPQIKVERRISYELPIKQERIFNETVYCLQPTEYLRVTNLLIKKKEGEGNDEE